MTGVLNFSPLFGLASGANTIITLLVGLAFVIAHGSAALGWRNLGVFLLITVVVSFSSEAMGVATGLVFGQYYYTDLLGPKILGVPPLIQVGYVTVGYASLITARIIIGVTGVPRRGTILAVALVGAFVMVGWDVAMDPYQSTLGGDWIWPNGGSYFGVALHNYVGWFGTVFLYMFLYQLYASKFPERVCVGATDARIFWSQPVLYYALTALGIVVVPWVGGVALPYASPANYTGTLDSLTYSLALVAFFVMGTPVVAALARVLTGRPLPGSVAPVVEAGPLTNIVIAPSEG